MTENNYEGLGGFEFHFVVRYSVDDKEFSVDIDTADAKFSDGSVFTGHEWYLAEENNDPLVYGLMRELEDKLATLLGKAQNPDCIHATVYENPNFESLTCLTCGEDVETNDDKEGK